MGSKPRKDFRGCVLKANAPSEPFWEEADAQEAFELDRPFDQLEEAKYQRISLGPLANLLDLAGLRRFLHRACYLTPDGGEIHFLSRDPDDVSGLWPGELYMRDGFQERYRPLRHFVELLRLFPCEVKTPQPVRLSREGSFLHWRAERLPRVEYAEAQATPSLRYDPGTQYRRFDRLEEPETADDLYYASALLKPRTKERILALGVNDGRELEMFDAEQRAAVEFWGVDHSEKAISKARERFPEHAERFFVADFGTLHELALPNFDICLLLNILQCTTVDRDPFFRTVMGLLNPQARVLISIPNCHFGASDVLRRPLDRRDPRHDRSLVHKDLRYLTRELYRQGFSRVESFGTYDAFLLALRGSEPGRDEP